MSLPDRLLELHRSLAENRIPHAFGGAIALAYWTREPRGTRDIDVNIFLPSAEAARALSALPGGIAQPADTAEVIARDGQIRLWWDDTPVDLFFSYEPIHDEAARHRQEVPFAGERIPILGPTELAIFKAAFDRTRDWADIEAMVESGSLDVTAVRAALESLLGADDPRIARLDEAVRRIGDAQSMHG